jgi:formylglycine-generating enzyme required for sulfatase activity
MDVDVHARQVTGGRVTGADLSGASIDGDVTIVVGGRAGQTLPKPRQWFEPELVDIVAGPFLMGSDPAKPFAWPASDVPFASPDSELPQCRVVLPAFRIGKYPVTNDQFKAFLDQSGQTAWSELRWDGQSPPRGKERHPVSGVTWFQALAYSRWLSEQTGRFYALPNEAQWEKAARGVDGWIFPWGDEWDPERCHQGHDDTAAVDAYMAQSLFGCYDLVGNVREWTCSLWGGQLLMPDDRYRYPWPADGQEDGRNELSANGQVYRVCRGGSLADDPPKLRCAARVGFSPQEPGPRGRRHGLRVVELAGPAG